MSIENDDFDSDADVEPETVETTDHIKYSRKAFSKLATELNDEDLQHPGVQKMLLAEISRLESGAIYSEAFKGKYYKAERECAVLKEKGKTFIFSEILYSVSLTLGAALIGIAPSVTSATNSPMIVGVIGALLVAGAIVAKVVKK